MAKLVVFELGQSAVPDPDALVADALVPDALVPDVLAAAPLVVFCPVEPADELLDLQPVAVRTTRINDMTAASARFFMATFAGGAG